MNKPAAIIDWTLGTPPYRYCRFVLWRYISWGWLPSLTRDAYGSEGWRIVAWWRLWLTWNKGA